jgi:hypothetical protein
LLKAFAGLISHWHGLIKVDCEALGPRRTPYFCR